MILNNEAEKFLSCGEVLSEIMTSMSNPANKEDVQQIDFHKGDKVYYQKSKGYDTHNNEYQVVNITDIIYVEAA